MSPTDALRFGAALVLPWPAVPLRVAREWSSTQRAGRRPAPPAGHGRPVLLVPGFLAGDASLARLGGWLRSGGWRAYRSGIPLNVDCAEPLVTALETRAQSVVARAGGQRLTLIGQSRGGSLSRAVAVRRPDLIETLVTLGSPVRDQLGVHPRTRLAVTAVGLLGSAGIPGLFTRGCADGPCCARARADVLGPFPAGVRYLAVYSPCDEVVRADSCLDPAAEQIAVTTSHVGMGLDARVWRELAARL
ncbi:MAG: triacylglycerol lipase [Baekduia sp.]|nr:triacylglycerol lipase [Baekduia sp.]